MNQIELIEKRKPREKHFLQEDGTIRAEVYAQDVHYLKNGKYEEIDNTLVRNNDVLVNKGNSYKVEYNDNISSSLMKISKDSHYIDFKLMHIEEQKKSYKRKNLENKKNIVYDDINSDIAIEYHTLSDKVKEIIILKNNNISRLSFELKTDLILKIEEGFVNAFDKDNKIVFQIEKPFMVDSNNAKNNNIYYSIDTYDDAYVLNLILDDEWLNDKSRVYPIYIDPTISNQNNEISLYDTYIYPGDTNDTRYNKAFLKAGVEKVNNVVTPNRTLIKFSLPSIGTGSEIVYATLDLTSYPTYTSNPPERLAVIHQITSNWDETTANWSNMNDKYNSKVESIFYGHRSTIDNNTVVPAYSYYDGNITNIVKKWYRDVPNYGLMIKAVDESVYVDDDFPVFYSNDNGISGSNPKPIVSITYRNHNGLENYLDYKEQIFSIGSSYVNTYNGNLTSVFTIGHTMGGNLPVNLKLIYNTNDVVLNKETFFSVGYKLNFEQTIKVISINNNEFLEYEDEDGTIHYFEFDQNENNYRDQEGLGLVVEKTSTTCIMKDEDNNTLTFNNVNNIYRLVSINDYEGNSISVVYNLDNSIEKIVDNYNNEVEITYDVNTITISSPDEDVSLVFLNDKLIRIETLKGNLQIDYNNQLIDTITDITGIKTAYEYYENTPYRVKKVKRLSVNNVLGEYFNLNYGFESTSIVNSDNRTTTIIYNSYGNVVSKNSLASEEDINNAYSLSSVVGDTNENRNRILSKETPIRFIKNYLSNASFESNNMSFSIDTNINYSFDTDNFNSGLRSLKLESLAVNKKITQTITIPKGEYYTFSGYFKNTGRVKITLAYYDSNNERVENSEIILSSNVFDRNDVTLYYDENASSDLILEIELVDLETVYIDDIQLEKGETANSFNLIENPDFSNGYSDWTLNGWTYDDSTINPSDSFSLINFNNNQNKALKVSVKPTYGVSFTKVIPVKGKQGDLYTCSFWFKNEGYPGYGRIAGSEVSIYFKPIGSEAEHCIATSGYFNPNGEKWQFFTYKAVAPEDFESIKLVFLIGREANDFYLTNLSLYKNVTGGQYNYDDNGNLISVTDQSNNVTSYKYDSNNQLINMITPTGKNYRYEYDNEKKSRLLKTISSNGLTTSIIYDSNGNPVTTKVMKNYVDNIESGSYKIRNKGTSKFVKAEFNTVFLEKNECSNTIWEIEKVQNKYKIKYSLYPQYSISYRNGSLSLDEDDSNNLFYIEKNLESSNGTFFIKYYEETPTGTNVKYLTANGNTLSFNTFDSYNPNIEFYIELNSQLFVENDAKYTNDGRFIQNITDSNFSSRGFTYNSNSGLISSVTNKNGKITSYLYNNKNQLIKILYEGKYIEYEYNSNNLLSEIIQDNKTYSMSYDDFLNLVNVTLNNSINLVDYSYNSSCQLTETSYGNNDVISYEYDDFGRIAKTSKTNNIIHYYYGNTGYLSKIKDNYNIYKFYYDVAGRLYKYIDNDFKINYTYDDNDLIINKKYMLGNTLKEMGIEYSNDLPIKVENLSDETNYTYDELDRVINKNINNIISISYKYKTNGKRTTNLIEEYEFNNVKNHFVYDSMGNIVDIYTNNTLTKHYEYDDFGKIVTEYNYDLNNYIEYVYDNAGNITQSTVKNISDDSIIEQHSGTYSNLLWEDQLTSYDNNTILYDTIGNITQYKSDSFEWKNGRELYKFTNNLNNSVVTYEYNDKGYRISKTINGVKTKYHLENKKIIFEETNNNYIYYIYDLDGIVGIEYNNDKYYFKKNFFNDVIAILDDSGNIFAKYEYDSWGNVLSIKDNNDNIITNTSHIGIVNPIRYRSYYYDNESRLYYLGTRYYNPEIKRFISPDTVVGANQDIYANNLYLYASDNPINNFEVEGNSVLGIILGYAVAQAAKAVAKKVTQKKAKNTKKNNKAKKKTVVQVTTSSTVQTNLTLGGFVKSSLYTDVSTNSYTTYTKNVYGNDGIITIDYNNTNIFESSLSLGISTPVADISISKGFNNGALRIEKKYDEDGKRSIFECGNDTFSFYCEKGYDTYIDEEKYTTTSTKISFSKVLVALAVYVGAEIGVEEAVGILVKAMEY